MHRLIVHRAGARDDGFTLIELLVVVIVIGLLAAIALPVYLTGQNGSKEAGTRTDLESAKTALISYWTSKGTTSATPTLDADATTGLAKYGYTRTTSATTSVAFIGGAPTMSSFCIQAVAVTTKTFHITQSDGVLAGGC